MNICLYSGVSTVNMTCIIIIKTNIEKNSIPRKEVNFRRNTQFNFSPVGCIVISLICNMLNRKNIRNILIAY